MSYKSFVGNALVTGASSGIGRSAAIALGKAGWNLTIAGRRRPELEETARLSRPDDPAVSKNTVIEIYTADLTEPTAVDGLFEAHMKVFDRLDVIFNNAGVAAPKVDFEDTPLELWNSILNINLTVPFLCSQKAFKIMKNQSPQGGRIINNGSVAIYSPRAHSVCYTCSKTGISGLTKQIALDGRPYSIACSQLDIGNTSSQMTAPSKDSTVSVTEPTFHIDHTGQAVLYMASLPLDVNILNQTLMATTMPLVGRG